MTDIVVFYNVCDLPGGRDLMLKQMIRFCQSELATKAKTVFVMMNGQLTNFLDLARLLENNSNVRMVHVDTATKNYEYAGLKFLKEYCDQLEEEQYIMYWHLKGVSHLNNIGVQNWREYMEYWNIDRYQDCIEELDNEFDTVGTNWIDEPFLGVDRVVRNWKHYSGNFWWARSSYIKKLKPLKHPDEYTPGTVSEITGYAMDGIHNNWRFDHEGWIGSGDPVAAEVHSSHGGNHDNQGSYPGWHYHYTYPESAYK
jgi:hypothetical protein